MNLADAIRKAADGLPAEPTPVAKAKEKKMSEKPQATVAELKIGSTPDEPVKTPEQASPHINNGNVVRLELFLTAEQMSGLFRAIMAGQHSVMTSREAAAYLRISKDRLERLADEGEIPGIILDGRWRFPKPNLDEWMMMQSTIQDDEEDEQNVA